MVATVEYPDLHIGHGITRQYTGGHRGFKTLRDRRDELLGDGTAKNIIHKLEMLAFVLLQPFLVGRPDREHDVGELTAATGLLLQHLTVFYSGIERFFIGDLGRTLVYFYFEFPPHPVDDDLKVQ